MGATYTVTRVKAGGEKDNPHGGKLYKFYVGLANETEDHPDVYWQRKSDSLQVGETVYGTVSKGDYGWRFKTEQRPTGSQNGLGGSSAPDDAFWAAKDRRLARAGMTQAIVTASDPPFGADPAEIATYVKDVNEVADALLAALDQRTPAPSASAPAPASPDSGHLGSADGKDEGRDSPATPQRKGATSRRLTEAGIADRDTQKAIVHAFADPPTVEALDAVDAAVKNQDWHLLFDEHGLTRPPRASRHAGPGPRGCRRRLRHSLLMETMDEANRADMRAERLMKDASRAIAAVLDNGRRTHPKLTESLMEARERLDHEAAHIVAVWD